MGPARHDEARDRRTTRADWGARTRHAGKDTAKRQLTSGAGLPDGSPDAIGSAPQHQVTKHRRDGLGRPSATLGRPGGLAMARLSVGKPAAPP